MLQFILRVFCVFGETWAYLRRAEQPGARIANLKTGWAHEMLRLMRIEVAVSGTPFQGGPAVFVGNHLSYLDVLLLMREVADVNFVAKQELARWPLFGRAARAAGTVFVDRGCLASRMRVRNTLGEALERERKRIAIFPSGTTSLHEDTSWKKGAFRIAADTSTPLQAFRISYSPLRKAAFIGADGFLTHLLRACAGTPIRATIEFAEPVLIADPAAACTHWQEWTKGALLTVLPEPSRQGRSASA